MIWIKVIKQDISDDTIYLPKKVAEKLPKEVTLQFGLKEIKVNLCEIEKSSIDKKNSFEDSIEVLCGKDIIQKLYIKESLIYQMIYKDETLYIGPVIGLLLGEQSYYYHNRNMQGFTRGMDIYNEIGGLFIAFKDISIDWNSMVINGLYYDNEVMEWRYGTLPFPSVVFRRAFYTSQKVVDELKRLTGNRVFNSTRFDKWEMHKILERHKNFQEYLPETKELIDIKFFHNFMNKYSDVILKPAGLSRGRGICFVHRINDNFGIYDYRISDNPRFYIVDKTSADEFIENNFIQKNYIIQEQVKLATINGAPFDIRIVIGKNEDKRWRCRGIECRKAGAKNKITNISRGGQALSINNAMRLAFGPCIDTNKIRNELISVALKFCEIMDNSGEHFAEFGLDFAIDPNKHYWFIEANVRPVFRGFKQMDYENYLHIRHMPLLYAASLAGFGKGARDSEPKAML